MTMNRRDFLRKAGTVGALGAAMPILSACGVQSPGINSATGGNTGGNGADPAAPNPFQHGIASGDPLPERVMLWTRVTPQDEATAGDIPVTLRVWDNIDLSGNPVFVANVATNSSVDFTVKVDALLKTAVAANEPASSYYYRFEALGWLSQVGRTRTAPAGEGWKSANGGFDDLKIGVVSCSSGAHGFFHSYHYLSQRPDLDYVLHLGDYIYEYGNDGYGGPECAGSYGSIRAYDPPHEMFLLDHYRRRHKWYKEDGDLQAVHQQHAFINTWDDHESTNNSYRDAAQNHQEDDSCDEGQDIPGFDWNQRKAFAIAAYFEYLPIRPTNDQGLPVAHAVQTNLVQTHLYAPNNPDQAIFRSFAYGNLVDLVMLDTRLYDRDIEPMPVPPTLFTEADVTDQFRRMIGNANDSTPSKDQFGWLKSTMEASQSNGTTWRLLGQQVMLGQWRLFSPASGLGATDLATGLGIPASEATTLIAGNQARYFNPDQWDGYPQERQELLNLFKSENNTGGAIENIVVLTGDIHTSWAMTVQPDPDGGTAKNYTDGTASNVPVAVEFITPSVSSPGLNTEGLDGAFLRSQNPHMRMSDLSHRGYVILTVNEDKAHADWYWFKTNPGTDPQTQVESEARPQVTRECGIFANSWLGGGTPALQGDHNGPMTDCKAEEPERSNADALATEAAMATSNV